MRSFRLVAVVVLAVVLALSSGRNAFASQWIVYDDGTAEIGRSQLNAYIAVKFSAPDGSMLLRIAYYCYDDCDRSINLYILDSLGQTVLFGPQSMTPVISGDWSYVDVNILVPFVFYAAVYWPDLDPDLGVDIDNGGQTFLSGTIGNWLPYMCGSGFPPVMFPCNFMVRAEVEPATPSGEPVGGLVMPANTFALVWPWLAAIVVVGCVGTVVVVRKKRER